MDGPCPPGEAERIGKDRRRAPLNSLAWLLVSVMLALSTAALVLIYAPIATCPAHVDSHARPEDHARCVICGNTLKTSYLAKWTKDILSPLLADLSHADQASREKAAETILAMADVWTKKDIERIWKVSTTRQPFLWDRQSELLPRLLLRRTHRLNSAPPAVAIDALMPYLRSQQGKVARDANFGDSGFTTPAPVLELIAIGPSAEPFLLAHLRDGAVRNEIAVVLKQIGSTMAIPELIECLPAKDGPLSEEEELTYLCLVEAISEITGATIGLPGKWHRGYERTVKGHWQTWYSERSDYLYDPRVLANAYSGSRGRFRTDMEALVAGVPSGDYRQDHPWVTFEEIKDWSETPEYAKQLKRHCFWRIVDGLPSRDSIRHLGRLKDPEVLPILHALCGKRGDWNTYDLAWTLGERGSVSSIPYLRNLAAKKDEFSSKKIQWAIDRLELIGRFGETLEGKPLDVQESTLFLEVLAGRIQIEKLLEAPSEHEHILARHLNVAGFVRLPQVCSALRRILEGEDVNVRSKMRAAVALARHGEGDPIDFLKRYLRDASPRTRFAAACGLSELDLEDGVETLIDILMLRPLETGAEGVSWGEGTLTVRRLDGTWVELIRDSCDILGVKGMTSAVSALRGLLEENLNGINGVRQPNGGFGFSGRPDVVALARLGDFSGMEVLKASLRNDDPIDAAWDYVRIAKKRFIPDLIPLLHHENEELRIRSAAAIVILLESGD